MPYLIEKKIIVSFKKNDERQLKLNCPIHNNDAVGRKIMCC